MNKWIATTDRLPEREDAYFSPNREFGGRNITGLVLVLYKNGFSKTEEYKAVGAGKEGTKHTHWAKYEPPMAPELEGFEQWILGRETGANSIEILRECWVAAQQAKRI